MNEREYNYSVEKCNYPWVDCIRCWCYSQSKLDRRMGEQCMALFWSKMLMKRWSLYFIIEHQWVMVISLMQASIPDRLVWTCLHGCYLASWHSDDRWHKTSLQSVWLMYILSIYNTSRALWIAQLLGWLKAIITICGAYRKVWKWLRSW